MSVTLGGDGRPAPAVHSLSVDNGAGRLNIR